MCAMKHRLHPVNINLKELPPEGRDYEYSSESGELTSALKDLLHNNAYLIQFHLKPMGNTYELKGELKTQLNLQCSLCAFDLKHPLNQKFHEFLIVESPLEKGDQHTRVNHAHELTFDGPEATILESESFSVPDYFHELIGLAEPIRPVGSEKCDQGTCENLKEIPKRDWLTVGAEAAAQPTKANPFKILEKIKLRD